MSLPDATARTQFGFGAGQCLIAGVLLYPFIRWLQRLDHRDAEAAGQRSGLAGVFVLADRIAGNQAPGAPKSHNSDTMLSTPDRLCGRRAIADLSLSFNQTGGRSSATPLQPQRGAAVLRALLSLLLRVIVEVQFKPSRESNRKYISSGRAGRKFPVPCRICAMNSLIRKCKFPVRSNRESHL
jgi:hypothetical protein